MKNNIYYVAFNKKGNDTASVNDDNYNGEGLPEENNRYLSRLSLALRYVLAILLYLVVAIPLSIFSALKWLILLIGGIAIAGISIFYFMGSGTSGYLVFLCWLGLGVTGNVDVLLNQWIENRYPFRLLKVAKG